MDTGARLGHYQIIEQLGAGGMGEVYRARDAKLDREVAIKVLPRDFADDHDRLARFKREAKILAALNHANIAAIYGLEDEGNERFIVMEVVEGETLAERIARSGRIEVEEALRIARQIAEALEFAHDQRVIHRDIKPANIKITPGGQVKVLDFGIAKAWQPDGSDAASDGSQSPTELPPTGTGVIMGTVAYMSPEQARGRHVDRRADIWALGCVLYEMLAGRRAFPGDNVSDVLAAILKEQPNWSALPADVPGTVRVLLARMLRKDPDRRLHDVADARIELEESGVATAAFGAPTDPYAAASMPLPSARHRRRGAWQPWALVAVLGAALAWSVSHPPAGEAPVQRFAIPLEGALDMNGRPTVQLSPDGRMIAYVTASPAGNQLWLREIEGFEATAVPQTSGAVSVFWSPDSEWVAFADGALKKVSVRGGPPVTITPLIDFLGGDWGADGQIVFSDNRGLMRVPADGGDATPVGAETGLGLRFPQQLPDGAFLGTGAGLAHVAADGTTTLLVPGAFLGRYDPSGWLVFGRGNALFVATLDLGTLDVGSEMPVLNGVRTNQSWNTSYFSLAGNGTLLWAPGTSSSGRRLMAIDRGGRVQVLLDEPDAYYMPRASPDGRRVAVVTLREGEYDIWMVDLERGIRTRFPAEGSTPAVAWSADGTRLAYAAARASGNGLFARLASGTGPEETLALIPEGLAVPISWGADGALLFTRKQRGLSEDVWAVVPGGEPVPFLDSDQHESAAVKSPDGRYVAYARDGVHVALVETPEAGITVAGAGAWAPRWSVDGSELYYVDSATNEFLAVTVRGADVEGGLPELSEPQVLFTERFAGSIGLGLHGYDVLADGRFVFVSPDAIAPVTHVNVQLKWLDGIRAMR